MKECSLFFLSFSFSLQFLCFANSLHSLFFRFQQQQTPLLSAAHFSVVFAGTAFASAAAAAAVAWHFIFALSFRCHTGSQAQAQAAAALSPKVSQSVRLKFWLAPESDSHQFLHARMCVCVCVCLNWKKCSSFFFLSLKLAANTGFNNRGYCWVVGWLVGDSRHSSGKTLCVKKESELLLLLPFAVMVDGSCKHKLLLLLLPLLKRRPTFGLYECVCLCLYFAAFLLVFFIFICFSLQ